MPNNTRSHLLAAIAVALFATACSNSEPITGPKRALSPLSAVSREVTSVPGRHIFVMSGGIPADFAARVAGKGGTVVDNFAEAGTVITSGLSDADAASLSAGGLVANDVTAQWVPSAQDLNVSVARVGAPSASARSPFQAAFLGYQWNMFQIHAPEAWAANKLGSPSVKVAILDSGIDPDHLDLSGLVDLTTSARVIASPTACLFSNSKALWTDDLFHGTFVSGIVTSNNFGVAGVAPNVRLVAVKVLDDSGNGRWSDLICGLQYAVLIAKARVINMSIGATFKGNTPGLVAFQQFLAQFVDFARARGVVVVTAAGNENKNLGNPHPFLDLPCEAGAQLCVSATSNRDKLAHYSNFGRAAIDVAAPGGEDHYLTNKSSPADTVASLILGPCARVLCGIENGYLIGDGTSFAAPHVSGLAALIASQNPMLSADGIMSLIRQTADDIGSESKFGDGRINVARALGVPLP